MGVAARAAHVPHPLAAKLLKVGAAPQSAPRDTDAPPTFLPRPSAFWRALRDEWLGKRGGTPGQVATTTTIPKTTIADVVEVANHVTAALRNDLGRVDEVTAIAAWDYWRERVKFLRKLVARATDDTAIYPRNENLWASELRHLAILLSDVTRNAGPRGIRVHTVEPRADGARTVPSPLVSAVDILWSDDARMPIRTFPSLAEADAAFATAFAPLRGRAFKESGFRIRWTDGKEYEGVVQVTPEIVAAASSRGGILRAHLESHAHWLQGPRHTKLWHHWYGATNPDGLAARRAWGHELAHRLATDAVVQRGPEARRNRQQGMPYVGGGVPDFRPTKRAAAMFAGLSLLPNPAATVEALWQRYRDANGPDSSSHDDPPAPLLAVRDLIAIANFITAELRRDLRSVFAQDAAVVWKKWRDVALDLRVEIRGRDPHAWSTYRAFPLRIERLARDLETARSAPGKLFEAFCPWREAYFTASEIRPDQRSGNWRKSRLEVNAWVPS